LNSEKFLFSNNISLSDIALLPFVRQFSNVDIIWFRKRFIHLSGWMDGLIGMEIFQAMMKKFEIWNPPGEGEEVIFNN